MDTPESVELAAIQVMGLSTRTSNTNEMSGPDGRIGPLWGAFMQLDPQAIPGVTDPQIIYSVYTGYESDHNGAYDIILGRSVHNPSQVPEGMKVVQLAAGRYLVFRAADPSPDAIRAAWKDVYAHFGSGQERAFTADFEKYSAHGVELHIAVR